MIWDLITAYVLFAVALSQTVGLMYDVALNKGLTEIYIKVALTAFVYVAGAIYAARAVSHRKKEG